MHQQFINLEQSPSFESIYDTYIGYITNTTGNVVIDATLNSLASKDVIMMHDFQTRVRDLFLSQFLRNWPTMDAEEPFSEKINIGSDNGLVPSGNKP